MLFAPPARGTLQLSLTLLLRYRSRVVFRVGSLCLPNSRAISNARYSGYLKISHWFTSTGLSPSMAPLSRGLWVYQLVSKKVETPHLLMLFAKGFGLPYWTFTRCYSPNLNWFLFLCLLRCFNSAGSRFFHEWRNHHVKHDEKSH